MTLEIAQDTSELGFMRSCEASLNLMNSIQCWTILNVWFKRDRQQMIIKLFFYFLSSIEYSKNLQLFETSARLELGAHLQISLNYHDWSETKYHFHL